MTRAELFKLAEDWFYSKENVGGDSKLSDVEKGFIAGFLAGRDAAIKLLDTKKPEYAYRAIKALGE